MENVLSQQICLQIECTLVNTINTVDTECMAPKGVEEEDAKGMEDP